MISWWVRLSVSVAFSVVGCGDDPAGAAVVGKPVDVTDGKGAVDTIVRMDVDPGPDLTPGAGLDSRGIDPDTFGADMGSSCGSNADCESGFCVHGQNGDVCTIACVSSCPEGWACRQPSVGGDDVTFICLPQHVTLCRPCVDSATCATGGTQDKAYCADLGAEGQYCATPCDESTPCPAGYSCKAPVGKVDSYCLPDSGKCDCDAVATAQGMHTSCSIANDAGTCPGTRTCGLAGLGTCEGQTPKAEACNDLDDDCDGQTDEGFPTKGKPCDGDDVDECADGAMLCGANGPECLDDAASTNEACDNGKDDDCDGETDEGCCNTPGSPCCADSQCSDPLTCQDGLCVCSQTASAACTNGDAWNLDCHGNKTTVKAECGTCACTHGVCNDQGSPTLVCSGGDVYSTDCAGDSLQKSEECGVCSCLVGACLKTDQADTTCEDGDAYFTDCLGTPTSKKDECGLCSCSGGACVASNQAALTCSGGDAWWTSCDGTPTGKSEDCGACGCAKGVCEKNDKVSRTCSGGDAYWTDCLGEVTTVAEDCNGCGCVDGACVVDTQAGTACGGSDVYYTDCMGNLTLKKSACGSGCGCSNGACNVKPTASTVCQGGDVFWRDCNGTITTKKESCSCGCGGGACIVGTCPCVGTPWGDVADGFTGTGYSDVTPAGTCAENAETRTCQNGVLSGSYTALSCTDGCTATPFGDLPQGTNVTGYSTATPAGPCSAVSQQRVCNDGTLSGTFNAPFCTDGCPVTAWGPLTSGATVTAYSSATPAGACADYSESRTCKSGVLSGTLPLPTCSNGCVGTPWGDLATGAKVTGYSSATPAGSCAAASQERICANGTLSGTYPSATCLEGCTGTVWGNLANGATVTAYSSATPAGTCAASSEVRACQNGVLGGSFPSATCGEGCDGTPWGDLPGGAKVTAYSSAAPAGACSAVAQERTCTNGTLSGGYTHTTCVDGCTGTTWGNLASGATVTAYSSATPAGTCAASAEMRTCKNGVLGGTFTSASCTDGCVGTPWGNLASGTTVTAYSTATPAGLCSAVTQERTCTGGTLSGTYASTTCTSGCTGTAWGDLANGAKVTAYSNEAPAGTCASSSQIRTCNDGVLGGTYPSSTCTDGCIGTPWGNLAHGTSVTAYATATPPGPCSTVTQQRTCVSGTLSGTYASATCSNGCPGTAWGDLPNGATVTAYSSATPAGSCASSGQLRTCTDGVLGGTYPSATCTDGCVGTPWGNLASGATVTGYSTATPTGLCSVVSQQRTCTGGALSGSHSITACLSGCAATAWGDLPSGTTVTAYSSATPAGACSSNSQVRTCTDGALGGTYPSATCTSGCSGTAWGNLATGTTVTAYSTATPAGTCASVSQSRTCSAAVLSGTHANASCTAGCTLSGYGALTHGQAVTSYLAASVPCGSTCTTGTITCESGTLSGGSSYVGSCTVGSCCAANVGANCDKGSSQTVAGCQSDYVCASFVGIYYDSPGGCTRNAGSWIEYWFDGTNEWGASSNGPPGILGDATSAYHCTYIGNGTYDPFKNVPNGSCFNSSAAGYGSPNTWTKVTLGGGCSHTESVYVPGIVQCNGTCQ